MPKYCVAQCPNSLKKVTRIAMFSFPGESQMRKLWIEAIKIHAHLITESTRVCFRHFNEEDMFRFSTRTQLKSRRVPHLLLSTDRVEDTDTVSKKSRLEYSSQYIIIKNQRYEVHNCNLCKYFTNSSFLIKNHVRRHHLPHKTFNCEENALEIYHCRDCDFKTDVLIFFKKHLKEVHLTRSKNQIVKYKLKSFICRNCTFETYSSLHWLKHEQVGCPSPKKTRQEADGSKIFFDKMNI